MNDTVEKIKNFSDAMIVWAHDDKLKVVSDEVLASRKSICNGCDKWDKDGYAGLGMCKVCGCSGMKLYLPSSQCPWMPPKWTKISLSDTSSKSP